MNGRQPQRVLPLGKCWGAAIAERRQHLGLTQADLARLCRVTQQTISKIESGAIIPLDRLKLQIARSLATQPGALFVWPDDLEVA